MHVRDFIIYMYCFYTTAKQLNQVGLLQGKQTAYSNLVSNLPRK